ncbi:MAG: hypothetical protein M0P59_03775 [Gallionella sp.]|jgi:hypothetical protein|nr:hypothetical protein [Gallionella sp.]MCK9353258.1 hypothetical protein [Gallionella sp.]
MTLQRRHSGAGRNPAKTNSLRSGQNPNGVPLRGELFDRLDSGFRRNDGFGGVK